MKFFLNLSIFMLGSLAFSQSCSFTLSGFIIDMHDNSALADATLIVAGSERSVPTDENGEYRISGLCEENYVLQISHPDCETQAIRIFVKGDTKRTIYMEHHRNALGDLEIVASGRKSETRTSVESMVTQDILENNSAASLGDALRALSGVSSLTTGNTVVKPIIQGLHSSRVVLITGGTRLQDQEWGAEHAPNIDVNAVGEVTVIKGAAGLQYGGDAVGGTIVIKPEAVPVKDTLFGRTILTGTTNGRGGSITSSVVKSFNNGWYGSVHGTYKRFGDFEAPDYILSNTGLSEQNVAVRIGLNKLRYGVEGSFSLFDKKAGILRSSHLGGAEDLVIAINSQEPFVVEDFTYDINPPRQEVTHQIAKLSSFYRFDNLGKLNFQIDYQRNNRLEFDIRRDSEDVRPSVDLELETATANIDFDYTADNSITAKIGVLARYQNHFPDPETGVRRLIPDYQAQDFGVYALGSKDFGKLIVEAGARYDYNRISAEKFYITSLWEERGYDEYFPEFEVEESGNQILVEPDFEYHNFSATAGLSYEIDSYFSLKANYSLASRAPNVSELFSDGLHQSAARIELGDLRFKQEVSSKIALSFIRESENWSFILSPFANYINDFILIEPTGLRQTIRGNFQIWEYRQTDARLLGFDVDNRFQLSPSIEINNQFSFVKGSDLTLNLPLIDMPGVNTRNAITYNIPGMNNLRLKLESNYVFRQNEFPDTNFEVFLPQTETLELVDVSTPPGAYHLVNFRGDVDFVINEKSVLNVGLMVNNLFDTSYREYLNRQRYYADDLGRNILVQVKVTY